MSPSTNKKTSCQRFHNPRIKLCGSIDGVRATFVGTFSSPSDEVSGGCFAFAFVGNFKVVSRTTAAKLNPLSWAFCMRTLR
jgi:hypothetical protein